MIKNSKLLGGALSSKKAFLKMESLPAISLEAEEASQFIDYIVDQSALMKVARVVRMAKESKNIRALGIDGNFLAPGATFSSSNYMKEFTENRIQLTSKEVRGAYPIFDKDLEDGPEGDAFADHIMRMITKKIANELELAFWIGDTASLSSFASTDIKSLWDGWRYRITNSASGETYENDVSGSATVLDATSDFDTAGAIAEQDTSAPYNWEFKYQQMLKSMPSEYKALGLQNLRFFNSDQVSQDYIAALSARSTGVGDQAIMGNAPLVYGRVPIVDVPLMPLTLDGSGIYGGGNYTDSVLTYPGNFIIGIQLDIVIEAQREAADRATYFFYTMRADVAMENVNAVVLTEKLTT